MVFARHIPVIARGARIVSRMSNVAEVPLPVEEFALRETLDRVPDVEFEVGVAAHGDDRVLPFVWATSEDLDSVENALDAGSSRIGGF